LLQLGVRRVFAFGLLVVPLTACIEEHPGWVGHEGSTDTHADDSAAGDDAATAETSAEGDESGSSESDASGVETGAADADASTEEGTTMGDEGNASAGDGDGGDGDGDGDVPQQIFISVGVWTGDFGTLDVADGHCQDEADAASLGGTWKAIMSTSAEPALLRLTITGEVQNMLGDVVASSATEFWSAAHPNPILYDQFGELSSNTAWTGTNPIGNLNGFSCDEWNPVNANSKGIGGHPDEVSGFWTVGSWEPCLDSERSLYCISQ
jgi:hypothetical protein